MGSTGKRTPQGVSERFVITRWDSDDQFKSPAMRQNKVDYFNLLKSLGVFGTDAQMDAYILSTDEWQRNQYKADMAAKYPSWGYSETTADKYIDMKLVDAYNHYMSFDEFKKACILAGGFHNLAAPGTMASWLHIFYYGANKNGYGRGKDARIEWDEVSGFSDFLDRTPQAHLNTDQPMYRGIRLSNSSLAALQKLAAKGGTMDFKGPSSWSMKENIAKFFTSVSLVGQRNQNSVIFENVTKGDHNAMPFLYGTDSEVIYSGHSNFQVLSVTQDDKGVYHVKVKEV